jgi:hypothetical protein
MLRGLCRACDLLLNELESGVAGMGGDLFGGVTSVAMARSLLEEVSSMLEQSAAAADAVMPARRDS